MPVTNPDYGVELIIASDASSDGVVDYTEGLQRVTESITGVPTIVGPNTVYVGGLINAVIGLTDATLKVAEQDVVASYAHEQTTPDVSWRVFHKLVDTNLSDPAITYELIVVTSTGTQNIFTTLPLPTTGPVRVTNFNAYFFDVSFFSGATPVAETGMAALRVTRRTSRVTIADTNNLVHRLIDLVQLEEYSQRFGNAVIHASVSAGQSAAIQTATSTIPVPTVKSI